MKATNQVPMVSPDHDTRVAASLEPKNNLITGGSKRRHNTRFGYVSVNENETTSVKPWIEWIAKNTDHDPEGMLELTRRGNKFNLPSRYPDTASQNTKQYAAFFDAVVKAGGRMFG